MTQLEAELLAKRVFGKKAACWTGEGLCFIGLFLRRRGRELLGAGPDWEAAFGAAAVEIAGQIEVRRGWLASLAKADREGGSRD